MMRYVNQLQNIRQAKKAGFA
jgi:hypothetical protein